MKYTRECPICSNQIEYDSLIVSGQWSTVCNQCNTHLRLEWDRQELGEEYDYDYQDSYWFEVEEEEPQKESNQIKYEWISNYNWSNDIYKD